MINRTHRWIRLETACQSLLVSGNMDVTASSACLISNRSGDWSSK